MSYKVHRFQSSDAGLAVNAYIVETVNGIVVVDATLLNSDSLNLRAKIDAIGKPLLAVLITHGHPDHIAGIGNVIQNDQVPVFALPSIVELMKSTEEAKHAQWSGMFGNDWINKWVYPNELVQNGDKLSFDGLNFSVYDVGGGGDCEANSIWELENGTTQAFVGDMIHKDKFTYMNDGQILR